MMRNDHAFIWLYIFSTMHGSGRICLGTEFVPIGLSDVMASSLNVTVEQVGATVSLCIGCNDFN